MSSSLVQYQALIGSATSTNKSAQSEIKSATFAPLASGAREEQRGETKEREREKSASQL